MNVFIAGGGGSLMNGLINRFSNEGHRIYVLTEKIVKKNENKKVFEYYYFSFDSDSLSDVWDSIEPDIIIIMGAYDTGFSWGNDHRESVRYLTGVTNLMLMHSTKKKGRLIYLSSEDVYSVSSPANIEEEQGTSPVGSRGIVLDQAEKLCINYNVQMGLDTVVARLDGLYNIPGSHSEIMHRSARLCESAVTTHTIRAGSDSRYSMICISDAVECIYRLSVGDSHKKAVYNISTSVEISDIQAANIIHNALKEDVNIINTTENTAIREKRIILSNAAFSEEFGEYDYYTPEKGLEQITVYMKSHRSAFLGSDNSEKGLFSRLISRAGSIFAAIFPFIENFVLFLFFFMLNNKAVGSQYFAKLDFLLLYVVILAMVYGQQQAVVAAGLAVWGYFARQSYDRPFFDVLIDYNTYVWVAQLLFLGLFIGYMKDRIKAMSAENMQTVNFLEGQLSDIRDINSGNVKMKNLLINQITNYEDSIGKIYSVVSVLDSYNEYEVLFYAADVVAKVMQCPDVAIYTVSDDNMAHLYSSTSGDSRKLGHKINYMEMGELSDCIKDQSVYMNKSFHKDYPLMARAIYQDDKPQLLIMLWGLAWDRMTLAQANMLTVVSYLIQNITIKANKYLNAIRGERYVLGTDILAEESFRELVHAHIRARGKGLTKCIVVCFDMNSNIIDDAVKVLKNRIYSTDYIGYYSGSLSVLLSNAGDEAAQEIVLTLIENGIMCNMWKPKLNMI